MPILLEEHFLVDDSGIHQAGKGLFSQVLINPGDTIGHYLGEMLTDEQVSQEPYINSDYILWLCTDHNIMAEGSLSNYTRYINHSTDPNSRFVVSTRWKTARVEAIKTILPGEEVFLDYGPAYWEAKALFTDKK